MKKKHRDILVDGQEYGWTTDYWSIRIWKDKKIIGTYPIPEYHDVTPKIVAGLIKDPENTLAWIHARPCPFCHAVPIQSKDSIVVTHEPYCWFDEPTTISKDKLNAWNNEHN